MMSATIAMVRVFMRTPPRSVGTPIGVQVHAVSRRCRTHALIALVSTTLKPSRSRIAYACTIGVRRHHNHSVSWSTSTRSKHCRHRRARRAYASPCSVRGDCRMRRCRRVPTTVAWPCRGRGRRRPRGRGVLGHPVDCMVAGARRRPARRCPRRWCDRAATRAAHRRSPARRLARPPGALIGMGGRPGSQTAASRRAGVGRSRRAGDRRPRSVADRTAHLVDSGTSARPAMGRSRGIWPRSWAGAAETKVG
jgi:hypothetical protein